MQCLWLSTIDYNTNRLREIFFRTWWAATSAVGSNIRGGQQHLRWAAASVVGSNICGGKQHYLRAINLMVGSDICGGQQHYLRAINLMVGSNHARLLDGYELSKGLIYYILAKRNICCLYFRRMCTITLSVCYPSHIRFFIRKIIQGQKYKHFWVRN